MRRFRESVAPAGVIHDIDLCSSLGMAQQINHRVPSRTSVRLPQITLLYITHNPLLEGPRRVPLVPKLAPPAWGAVMTDKGKCKRAAHIRN